VRNRNTKQQKRQDRLDKRHNRRDLKRAINKGGAEYEEEAQQNEVRHVERKIKPLRALTEAQGQYLCAIQTKQITFGIGPAGTGKSYCAVGFAADQLREKKIEKIYLTRPGVEAGESFGFLPGILEEKYAVYLDPVREILYKRLGKSATEYHIKRGNIAGKPLAFMRGSTFDDAIVILDEAQNCSVEQMKMFLSRIGQNCKFIIDGDGDQTDIKTKSGLMDAVQRLKHISDIGVVKFTIDDIVRNGLIKEILLSYQK
jgi:phosphate starvation-inducible PhoH-like protein